MLGNPDEFFMNNHDNFRFTEASSQNTETKQELRDARHQPGFESKLKKRGRKTTSPSFIPKIETVLTSFFNAKNKEGEPVEIKKSRARNLRKGQLFVVRPLKMFCKWQRKNSNEVMLVGLLSFAWMAEKKPPIVKKPRGNLSLFQQFNMNIVGKKLQQAHRKCWICRIEVFSLSFLGTWPFFSFFFLLFYMTKK